MTRQTNADNISDAIKNLGGTPKRGRPTTADLLDQLEAMLSSGGATQEDVRAIVEELLPDAVDETVAERIQPMVEQAVADALGDGRLDDGDFDDIFGD